MHFYHRSNDPYEHHSHRYRRGRHHGERHHRQRSQERRLPSSSRFEDEHAWSKKRQRSEEPKVDRGRVKRNHIETAAASPSPNKSWKESTFVKETMNAPVKELTPVKKPMPSIPYSKLDKEATPSKGLVRVSTPDKAPTPESSDKESTPDKELSSDNAYTPDKVSTPEKEPAKEPVKETVIALEADEEEEKAVMEPAVLSAVPPKPATTAPTIPTQREVDQPPLPRPWKEMKSRNGQKYYYNKDTGKSTWDRPAEERRRPSAEEPRPRHRSRDEPRPVAQNLVHRPVANRASPPPYDRYPRVRYEKRYKEELWVTRQDGRNIRLRGAYYYDRGYGRVSRDYR